MKRNYHYLFAVALVCLTASCQNDEPVTPGTGDGTSELPEWYYTGGKLGTSYLQTTTAFEQPTAVVEENFFEEFKRGEQLFEKSFNSNNEGVRHGLGPLYIRTSACTAIRVTDMAKVRTTVRSIPTK